MSDVDAELNASVHSVSSVLHTEGLTQPIAAADDCVQTDNGLSTISDEVTIETVDEDSDVVVKAIAALVISSSADSQADNVPPAAEESICEEDATVESVDATSHVALPITEPDSSAISTDLTDKIIPMNDPTIQVFAERLVEDERPPLEVEDPVAGSSSLKTADASDVVRAADSVVHQQSVYQIKWVKWKESKVPVITQNENGPCPLIAVMNVLLLLGKVKLSYAVEIITSDQLMEYLGDCILESAPKNISEGAQLNYEQNMHDAIAILPKLQTGLDVNVKFTGVHDFEYTPECIIFDLLNIPLYHGWLVDPQARDIVLAVGKLSYNQLVEKIITNKSSPNSDLVTEALIAENFLEKSASQLTYYGLCELNEVLKANELAILFRNNHFSTVFKHEGEELLQLVTDQGFLNESNVVWETLSNIEGDCLFVDANFVTVPPKAVTVANVAAVIPPGLPVDLDGEEQIQHDYLVALSLQEEQKREEEKAKMWQEYKEKELGVTDEMTDEELARRLHADEQRLAQEQAQAEGAAAAAAPMDPSAAALASAGTRIRQASTDSKSGKQEKKKSDCIIL